MAYINNQNGAAVSGAPLTTADTRQLSPALLRNSIDERIVLVRPTATPIDQLSRCAGARHAGSMIVNYYLVDSRPTTTKVPAETGGGDGKNRGNGVYSFPIAVSDPAMFDASETLLIPSVTGDDGSPLVVYVLEVTAEGVLEVIPINGVSEGYRRPAVPTLPAGTEIVRMGRAATELDVQTPQFQALPVKAENFCQIFKMQVEQTTLQKIADKEVGWNFSDQEEVAIIDMRLGMEKNFLFGNRARIFDPVKGEEVLMTGGIWNQTDKTCRLKLDTLAQKDLVEMCARTFTGNGGSKRKILVGGTRLIEALSNVEYNRVLQAGETFTKWGVEFREIRSNFGTLYVVHSEVFDQCGHASDGFILDPDYMTKYCHIPFSIETLNLRKAGVRNTDAVVITEASCLVLRYPDAHCRIIGE